MHILHFYCRYYTVQAYLAAIFNNIVSEGALSISCQFCLGGGNQSQSLFHAAFLGIKGSDRVLAVVCDGLSCLVCQQSQECQLNGVHWVCELCDMDKSKEVMSASSCSVYRMIAFIA